MTPRCPGRAKRCIVNPNHLQALAIRAAALAQLGRAEEAANATEVLLSNYPTLTVERHLRNFHWKMPADIAHYRDGLLKAGVPSHKLTLVGSRRSSPRIPDGQDGFSSGRHHARGLLTGQMHLKCIFGIQLTYASNSAKTQLHPEVVRRTQIRFS